MPPQVHLYETYTCGPTTGTWKWNASGRKVTQMRRTLQTFQQLSDILYYHAIECTAKSEWVGYLALTLHWLKAGIRQIRDKHAEKSATWARTNICGGSQTGPYGPFVVSFATQAANNLKFDCLKF